MSISDDTVSGPGSIPSPPFTLVRMVWAGMRHSWRISLSVALGVATATAVIVGALLVGDSMRGSLRGLTAERLGETRAAVAPGGFFQVEGIADEGVSPVALILFDSGVVEARDPQGNIRRAGSVQIIGCNSDFWELDVVGTVPEVLPEDDSVVMNRSTADELGVEVGDQVTVRLPVEQAVPADSPLGRRDIESEGLPRMTIVSIIDDRGLGRFSLSPSQAAPQNIFLRRETIASVLDRDGAANLLLFDREIGSDDLNVGLDDHGLKLERVTREFTDSSGSTQVIYDYYSLTSDRLLLPEVAVDRIRQAFPDGQVTAATTYLANAIERVDEDGGVTASVPYSTITAIDSSASLPLDYTRPDSSDDDAIAMVLNSWAAEQLSASVGDSLRVAYYEPEVEGGKEIERSFDAVVSDIVPITKPARPYRRNREATFDAPPTVYNDPHLTPSVPGVTDQDSISDWDLPFALKRDINSEDDQYWNDHRLTPKAFLPLEAGRRLFGSRFGQTTGLRIATSVAEDVPALQQRIVEILTPSLEELGWTVRAVRRQQLAASRGTTPFDGLFLSLSFFVILAAVMLIAMLFRLGLIQRMKQFGTLLAVGWQPRRVAGLAVGEGLGVASVGVLLGLAGGIFYAWGVLWALRSWWVGAVTVPFLTFHWTVQSLIAGALAGWVVAAITLVVTARWLMKTDAQALLSERDSDTTTKRAGDSSKLRIAAGVLGAMAVGIAAIGAGAGGQAAAGGFVGGGMLLLIAGLIAIYARLRQPRPLTGESSASGYSVGALAARNAFRHPLRSTMTIGLMATAAFLIIAIAAFRLQPTEKGTGGFTLIAQSAQPLYRDLSDPGVQSELLGPDANLLSDTVVATMRLKVGQDASCNNLYQATRPTVLGVPRRVAESFRGDRLAGFDWAGQVDVPEGESSDRWTTWDALDRAADGTESNPIPVILDQNTAMWSLQMMKGVGEIRAFEYESNRPIYFQVVGLLANSVLQGRLLIGESNFQRVFPEVSGYQYFLFAGNTQQSEALASLLENRLGDIGMDVSDASSVLSGMLAVQNTYLRTFQSLGGLGLLLGTIGLAVAQLRSVLERRQELAVLRAIGFTRKRLAIMVMAENTTLLVTGIGCGVVCAVLAVLPHALLSGLRPPIIEPLLTVIGIILFGTLAGLMVVRRVVRMPLLESLRSQ